LRLEDLNLHAATPGISRQPGFQAGVLEERLAVPAVLAGDLRQQKAASATLLHDQAVAPDFDFFDGADWTLRRQHGNLDGDMRKLARGHGRKARVRLGYHRRKVADDLGKARIGFDVSKAASKLTPVKNRHKGAEPAIQIPTAKDRRRRQAMNARFERLSRQPQQLNPIAWPDHVLTHG
jgi:hypothetical protein